MSKMKELAKSRAAKNKDIAIKKISDLTSDNYESYLENIIKIDSDIAVNNYGDEFMTISKEFSERTGLSAVDWSFCLLTIALQCARQYLITPFENTVDENYTKKADEKNLDNKAQFLNEENKNIGRQGGYYYSSFEKIISTLSVPYDLVAGSKSFDLKMGGKNHRYKTLGHDPILGYVFGTMNILTNTLTYYTLDSYHIRAGRIYSNAETFRAFSEMINRLQSDPKAVAAALIKQAIHINSDINTPNKIPFPMISTISPEFALELSKYGIHCSNLVTVSKQIGLSIAINAIMAMLHGFYCSFTKEENEKLNEVKTRKILLLANVISSGSNLLVTYLKANGGNADALRTLDVGGMITTLYRIVNDPKVIEEIENEFLTTNLHSIYETEYQKINKYYSIDLA